MIKIAIISDIHHCPEKNRNVKALLSNVLEQIKGLNPDLLVDLGDRISNIDNKTDLINMQVTAKAFKQIILNKHHILGNHDIKLLNKKQNEEIIQADFNMHSQILNGYRLIFWNALVQLDYENGFPELPAEEINWLKEELGKSKEPCIIFSHVPLDNDNMNGNYYFEAKHRNAHYPKEQSAKILENILESGKVIMGVNGHAHWHCYNKLNGINFITSPALAENFSETEDSLGFFGLLEIEDKKSNFKLIGTNDKTFSKINMEIN